ncbi:MAG: hypothetical protein ACI94Y_001374 [Maribacter sp.]
MKIINDKIISLLDFMSKYELNRFRKFLMSPYFNDSDDVLTFFEALDHLIRNDDISDVTRDLVWKRAFGKRKYIEQKYRRLGSDLTKLAYRFFSVEWHERDGLSGQEGVLKKVNAASLGKHYKTALRNFRKDLDDYTFENSDFYYYKYVAEYESHMHLERISAKRSTLSNLQQADINLDIYYIINKLKHYCDALNYKTFLSIEIEVKLLSRLMEFIEGNNYLKIPAVHIYYNISKTLTNAEDSQFYFKLVELLEQHYLLFPKQELRTLYIYATNYCITQINLGNADFYRILYELYFTLLMRRTIFNQEDELDERHYKNIITLGIRVNDYQGVEGFILEFSPKLKKGVRENALTYNLAHLYYAQKKYEKVIEQLRYVEYNDVFYALGSKFMLLRTYYEQEEFMAFEARWDSFYIYLRRNKLISHEMKTQYMLLLRFIKKIYNTPNYNKEELLKIKDKLENTPQIINKNWLLEKLDEILNNKKN